MEEKNSSNLRHMCIECRCQQIFANDLGLLFALSISHFLFLIYTSELDFSIGDFVLLLVYIIVIGV